jgi:hypothetical protein
MFASEWASGFASCAKRAAGQAADEFMGLLARLRVDETFTSEFAVVLKDEWAKRTGDNAALVCRLRAQLMERREAQEGLVEAYLRKDRAIMSVFDRMNQKCQEEIASLEAQIDEASIAEATSRSCWSSRSRC